MQPNIPVSLEPLKKGRIRCCVPFCRRTTAQPFLEWICHVHWPMVPPRLKAKRRLAKRIARHARQRFDRQVQRQEGYFDPQLARVEAAFRLRDQLWERCKRSAIEAAAGLR